jgi:hypothetical protein
MANVFLGTAANSTWWTNVDNGPARPSPPPGPGDYGFIGWYVGPDMTSSGSVSLNGTDTALFFCARSVDCQW